MKIVTLLKSVLHLQKDFLDSIPEKLYTQKKPILKEPTIGEQVRHILDFFENIWVAIDSDYDMVINLSCRRRNSSLNYSYAHARAETKLFIQIFDRMIFDKDMEFLVYRESRDEMYYETLENLFTELYSHVVHHHYALKLLVLLRTSIEINFPENFAKEVTTIEYEQKSIEK